MKSCKVTFSGLSQARESQEGSGRFIQGKKRGSKAVNPLEPVEAEKAEKMENIPKVGMVEEEEFFKVGYSSEEYEHFFQHSTGYSCF